MLELNPGYSNIVNCLKDIQCQLKVAKGNVNKQGDYKFRNAEDILTAVKPFLERYNLVLLLTDSIEQVGDNIYVKATAQLLDNKGYALETSAYAREAQTVNKILIAEPMLTGSSSSYARKYALNGLFALDDCKDIDDNMNQEFSPKPSNDNEEKGYVIATPNQIRTIRQSLDEKTIRSLLDRNRVPSLAELSKDSATEIVNNIFKGVYKK